MYHSLLNAPASPLYNNNTQPDKLDFWYDFYLIHLLTFPAVFNVKSVIHYNVILGLNTTPFRVLYCVKFYLLNALNQNPTNAKFLQQISNFNPNYHDAQP